MNVNAARLWQSLMDLAQIGATPKGGVCRIALTDADRDGRSRFVHWASEAGCTVRIDRIGNIFVRRAGRLAQAPCVLVGSHLDSQPTGGKFDGAYGVLAGLEVIRTLNDHDVRTESPIEVAVWTNEEGSRFVPLMMGSGVFAGVFPLEHALAAVDRDGKSVGDELARIGYAGNSDPPASIAAYFEAHIEQGPVLEQAGVAIGVGRGVLGIRWYDCTITGFEAHAGPTPMATRRDALQGAAYVMREVIAIAARHGMHGRGTVGYVEVYPNSRNVIPGRVKFTIDLRNSEPALLNAMHDDLHAMLRNLQSATGLETSLAEVAHYPPMTFDPRCASAVERAAAQLGHSHMDLIAGAGHDAIYLARVAPTSMIFIPCKGGISHNEIEDVDPAHAAAGADVLLQSVLEYAGPR